MCDCLPASCRVLYVLSCVTACLLHVASFPPPPPPPVMLPMRPPPMPPMSGVRTCSKHLQLGHLTSLPSLSPPVPPPPSLPPSPPPTFLFAAHHLCSTCLQTRHITAPGQGKLDSAFLCPSFMVCVSPCASAPSLPHLTRLSSLSSPPCIPAHPSLPPFLLLSTQGTSHVSQLHEGSYNCVCWKHL